MWATKRRASEVHRTIGSERTLYRDYFGGSMGVKLGSYRVMENKMETTIVYRGYISQF